MKAPSTNYSLVKFFHKIEKAQFWLLAIASTLIAIHITITIRLGGLSPFVWSILFWSAVAFLVWQKREKLNLESGFYASLIGFSLIAVVLWGSIYLPKLAFFRLSPFISTLGLSLLASGFRGLKQYRQELILLFFFNVPHFFILPIIDISAFTAKFAAYLLWYLGFSVKLEGFKILLPQGSVYVYSACSGLESILDLLRLSVLFLLLFPLNGIKKKTLLILASSIVAFVINGFRVALMAILTAAQNHQSFEYWHTGRGSLIFSIFSMTIFCGFYYLLLLKEISAFKLQSQEIQDS